MDKKLRKNVEKLDFRYKFPPLTLLLCVLVLLLCVAGITVTVFRMISNGGILTFYDFLKYPFLILICIFCIILIVALLIKSQYSLIENELVTQFGFVKTKYDVNTFTEMIHDREVGKLQIYFGEEFFILALDRAWADDFVHEILKLNTNIKYSYTLGEAPKNKE